MIVTGSTVVLDLLYLVTSIRACFCCVVEKSELRKKLNASGDMFLISTRCDSSSFPFICAAILIRVRKSCERMHSIHPWVVVATKINIMRMERREREWANGECVSRGCARTPRGAR